MNITITLESVAELNELRAFLNQNQTIKQPFTSGLTDLSYPLDSKPKNATLAALQNDAPVKKPKIKTTDRVAIRDKIETELYQALREKKDIVLRDIIFKYSDVVQGLKVRRIVSRWFSQPVDDYHKPIIVYEHTGIIKLPNASKPLQTFPAKSVTAKQKYAPVINSNSKGYENGF